MFMYSCIRNNKYIILGLEEFLKNCYYFIKHSIGLGIGVLTEVNNFCFPLGEMKRKKKKSPSLTMSSYPIKVPHLTSICPD